MIELNLLPQSKLENVKAKKNERAILLASVFASIVSIAILVLSVAAVGVQKFNLSTTASDLTKYENQLTQIPSATDILTTQNQLKTLVTLNSQKPMVTRLFSYLPQITPTQASISQLTVNFDQNSMVVNGTANNLNAVNEFADTLKFTTYAVAGQGAAKTAFTSVVLANFGVSAAGASYSFNISYDPALFDANQNVKLKVPQNYISTRSFSELPNSTLFSSGKATR